MGYENVALLALNRGLISRLALARADIKRVAWAAEIMTNWMPRVMGSMMFRPGLGYIGSTKSNALAHHIPFVFSTTDTALIEVTDLLVRVRVNDALITRQSVSTAFTNGTFTTDLTGWSDNDEGSASSVWATGDYLSLTGTHFSAAIRRQTLAISAADQNVEHPLRIIITRGPVTLRVGSTSGGDEYITETQLDTGTHSLAFTPTGASVYVQLSSLTTYAVLVDSIAIEASGTMEITAPWAAADLSKLRYDQSGDIIFIACDGYRQYKIERRAAHSWSVAAYETTDGPFRIQNTGTTTIAPSAITGDITLTASRALFRATHVGALFRLTSTGQQVTLAIDAENQFTDPIKVTGVDSGTTRTITIDKGTGWSGHTLTLQRSVGEPGSWSDVTTYSTTGTTTYTDNLNNQIIYYRLGIKTGGFGTGTATVSLTFASGGLTGVVRVKTVTNSLSATASVVKDLGGTNATEDWEEGSWSDLRGWPSSLAFYEGRLWWTGKGNFWGSVTDAYASFDDTTEGDSGPINRSIGAGPVDTISWLLPLQRLLAGTGGAEISARSTSFDEPLSPTNFNLKAASTQGSGSVDAVRVDSAGMFVQRGGQRVFQLAYNFEANDYAPTEMTELAPEVCSPGVSRMAVQRQPDTRIHCVLSDGTAAVLVFNRGENVICWVKVETDGTVEDVVVLPGSVEDTVYYVVNRTINGSTVRYLEKWALESQGQGAADTRLLDAHVVYSGAVTTSITGLDHLEGKSVWAWGDGVASGTYTVVGGAITLSAAAAQVCVGLPYTAQFKSTKLAYAAELGTAFNQKKKINRLGIIAADMHAQGLKYGVDFDHLYDLPQKEAFQTVVQTTVWEEYDYDTFAFAGEWSTDSRLCLQAASPRPATVLAVVIGVETHDRA